MSYGVISVLASVGIRIVLPHAFRVIGIYPGSRERAPLCGATPSGSDSAHVGGNREKESGTLPPRALEPHAAPVRVDDAFSDP